MKNLSYFTALLILVLAFTVTAAEAKKEIKVVKICPISGDDVETTGAGEIVKNYKVFLCCKDCQTDFDKLKESEKIEKIEKVLQKKEPAK